MPEREHWMAVGNVLWFLKPISCRHSMLTSNRNRNRTERCYSVLLGVKCGKRIRFDFAAWALLSTSWLSFKQHSLLHLLDTGYVIRLSVYATTVFRKTFMSKQTISLGKTRRFFTWHQDYICNSYDGYSVLKNWNSEAIWFTAKMLNVWSRRILSWMFCLFCDFRCQFNSPF